MITDVSDRTFENSATNGTMSTDLQPLGSALNLTGRDQIQQPAMDMLPCLFVKLVD